VGNGITKRIQTKKSCSSCNIENPDSDKKRDNNLKAPTQKSPCGGFRGLDAASGLLRRSCLTARNDDLPFCKGFLTAFGMTMYRFCLTFHVIARHEANQKIIVFLVNQINPDSDKKITSPTLSKGEEEHGLGMLYSVFRASAAPSPFGEGGGRGENKPQPKKSPFGGFRGLEAASGLLRRSYLTARNDDVPFCKGLRVKPAMTAFFYPVHLLILKILIQTNIQKKIIVFISIK